MNKQGQIWYIPGTKTAKQPESNRGCQSSNQTCYARNLSMKTTNQIQLK